MYSAFQSNAFQLNAFQIIRSNQQAINTGGGFIYVTASDRFKQEKSRLDKKRAELDLVEKNLADAELKKKEAIAQLKLISEQNRQKKVARELAALEASLQEEINTLRLERMGLIRRLDDEEAALVLLLSMPFIH